MLETSGMIKAEAAHLVQSKIFDEAMRPQRHQFFSVLPVKSLQKSGQLSAMF